MALRASARFRLNHMLTGSGVDEAWTTGTQLGEAVVELLRADKPFTEENLTATYEVRRRASWVERGAPSAEGCAQRISSRHGAWAGPAWRWLGLSRGRLAFERRAFRRH